MKPLLSIVVPIYNKDKYLQDCINCILFQKNIENLELILINDGSSDNSLELCKKNKRENFIIIDKKNEGPSIARNIGISLSKGEYVLFLDADDYISDDGIDKIIEWIKNENKVDVCFLEAYVFKNNGKIQKLGDNIKKQAINSNKTNVLKHLASRKKFTGSACTKLFRRDFLIKNNIEFPSDGRSAEDLGFVRNCIMFSEKFDKLDNVHYIYRQNENEISRSKQKKKSTKGIDIFIKETIDICCDNKVPKNIDMQYILNFAIYEYFVKLFIYTFSQEDILFLKQNKWICKYCENIKLKILYIITNLIGIDRIASFIIYCRKR